MKMQQVLFIITKHFRHRNWLFAFALISTFSPQAPGAGEPYGAYSLFPQGSSRVMGMGGAFTALSDDATGILYNPAGMPLSRYSISAGGTNNRVTNREYTISGSDLGYGEPYTYQQYGIAAQWYGWAIGGGVSVPYNYTANSAAANTYQFSEYNIALKIVDFDGMLARKLGEYFSVGIGYHYETLTEKYEQISPSASSISATGNNYYLSGGIAGRWKSYGAGVSYAQARRITIDPAYNAQIPNQAEWFRDVVIPAKTSFGAYWRVHERFMLIADYDIFDKPGTAIYVSSGISNSQYSAPIYVADQAQSLIHGGFEWFIYDEKRVAVSIRAGGYSEPARLAGSSSRQHLTYGFEVRFGPAILSVSFDQGNNFNNTSQGFALSLDQL